MPDFEIVYWTGTLDATSPSSEKVLVEGVDYTLPAAAKSNRNRVFAFLSNSHASGMGESVGGTNQSPSEFMFVIEDQDSVLTTIRIRRSTTLGTSIRATVCFFCYVGQEGGPNQFWVRAANDVQLNAARTHPSTFSTTAFAAQDVAQCIPVITGCRTNTNTRGEAYQSFCTASLENDGTLDYVQLTRSGVIANFKDAYVSYVVVEFNPATWGVQRLEFRSDDPYRYDVAPGTEQRVWDTSGSENEFGLLDITQATLPASGITAGLTALADITKALIFQAQFRIELNPNQGNDDLGENIELDSTSLYLTADAGHSADPTTHLITRRRTANGKAGKFTAAWILEWSGTGVPLISTQLLRYKNNDHAPSEEEVDDAATAANEAWSPALANWSPFREQSETVLLGMCVSTTSTASGTPRGFNDYRVTSRSSFAYTRSESSRDHRDSVCVVQLPSADPFGGSLDMQDGITEAVMEDWSPESEMRTYSSEAATMECYGFDSELHDGIGEAVMQ